MIDLDTHEKEREKKCLEYCEKDCMHSMEFLQRNWELFESAVDKPSCLDKFVRLFNCIIKEIKRLWTLAKAVFGIVFETLRIAKRCQKALDKINEV